MSGHCVSVRSCRISLRPGKASRHGASRRSERIRSLTWCSGLVAIPSQGNRSCLITRFFDRRNDIELRIVIAIDTAVYARFYAGFDAVGDAGHRRNAFRSLIAGLAAADFANRQTRGVPLVGCRCCRHRPCWSIKSLPCGRSGSSQTQDCEHLNSMAVLQSPHWKGSN